nr:MAG: DNA pilot protein [Microvirus Sku13]
MLGTIVGGIVSGAANTAIQSAFNDKSYAQNKDLMNYQNQLQMGNLRYQNAYNSPAALRQRLKDGNMNPDLALSGGAGIQPSGTPQSVTAHPQTPVDASSSFGSGISSATSAFTAYQNARKTQMDIKKDEIQLKTMYDENIARIGKLIADTDDTKQKAKYQEILNRYAAEREQLDIQGKKADNTGKQLGNDMLSAQYESQLMDNIMKTIDVANYPKEKELSLRNSAAQLSKLFADINLSAEQLTLLRREVQAGDIPAKGQAARNEVTNKVSSWIGKKLGKNAQSIFDGAIGKASEMQDVLISLFAKH